MSKRKRKYVFSAGVLRNLQSAFFIYRMPYILLTLLISACGVSTYSNETRYEYFRYGAAYFTNNNKIYYLYLWSKPNLDSNESHPANESRYVVSRMDATGENVITLVNNAGLEGNQGAVRFVLVSEDTAPLLVSEKWRSHLYGNTVEIRKLNGKVESTFEFSWIIEDMSVSPSREKFAISTSNEVWIVSGDGSVIVKKRHAKRFAWKTDNIGYFYDKTTAELAEIDLTTSAVTKLGIEFFPDRFNATEQKLYSFDGAELITLNVADMTLSREDLSSILPEINDPTNRHQISPNGRYVLSVIFGKIYVTDRETRVASLLLEDKEIKYEVMARQ